MAGQYNRNWPVPHDSRLERPMQVGQLFTIRGRINDEIPVEGDDTRVTINLSTDGGGYNANSIVMQTNIRFDTKETVFNDKTDGSWGKEEKKKNPFKPGDDFDIRIRALEDRFEIMVNHKDFHEFQYRTPLDRMSHLFVAGPITLYNINWGGRFYSVPYEGEIAGGLAPGKRLYLSGVVEKKVKRFNVNLMKSNGDIALQINPRFDESKNAVVRNSKQGGEWAQEEREGNCPFKKDTGFDLVIHNEPYSFQIFVNGELFCTFAHRMDPHNIVGLQVAGDVELQAIQVM